MNARTQIELEDVGAAVREGRALRPARGYLIQYAQGDANFRALTLTDPVPLGRQILTAAGVNSHDGYSLFGVLPSGDFEDVRLDEPFDLRAKGAERFIAFLTDRDFKLTLNDHQLAWGKPAISGIALYALAKPAPDQAIFLEVRGGTDRLVEPADLVDLTAPGVERFITGPKPVRKYEIIVNSRPEVVPGSRVTYEQVVQFAFPGAHGPNIVFAVTYRHAESKPHAGEMGPGSSVGVKQKGTIFNVTKTDKS
ncbi:multiubiquitin domain-containing protein [Oleiharenicola lentus]|uniref:multiubiquitin domain-containing protein n=1 Tax=Oleiharenicola lentus TaxID=2508720 RepID=UPI003F679062